MDRATVVHAHDHYEKYIVTDLVHDPEVADAHAVAAAIAAYRDAASNPWMSRPVWDHVVLDPSLRTATQLVTDADATTHAT